MRIFIFLGIFNLLLLNQSKIFADTLQRVISRPYIFIEYTGETNNYIAPIYISRSNKSDVGVYTVRNADKIPKVVINIFLTNSQFSELSNNLPSSILKNSQTYNFFKVLIVSEATTSTEFSIEQTCSFIGTIRNSFKDDSNHYHFLSDYIKSIQGLKPRYGANSTANVRGPLQFPSSMGSMGPHKIGTTPGWEPASLKGIYDTTNFLNSLKAPTNSSQPYRIHIMGGPG